MEGGAMQKLTIILLGFCLIACANGYVIAAGLLSIFLGIGIIVFSKIGS
jgi:hypothetical protein